MVPGNFTVFYHIWAWKPPWSCDQHYGDEFPFPCTYMHTKFGGNGPVATRKSQFKFPSVNDLGPSSRNDLDLQYSHIFINSISFRSQAAIFSKKSTFSYRKARLAVKKVKVNPGSSFVQTMIGRSLRCYIPLNWASGTREEF